MTDTPKYARLEIKRRWLVDLSGLDLSETPFREIEDLHIADSRLRLRKISSAQEVVFKLGKKYGKRTSLSEPITNLYLTEGEYRGLLDLPGHLTRKRRYSFPNGSLDVYLAPNRNLAVFEAEFQDEKSAREFQPPRFATREITAESEYSGVCLAERDVSASPAPAPRA
jgi:CYTH domain-containing protein